MNNKTRQLRDRVLAMCLSIMMIMSMLPIGGIQVFAETQGHLGVLTVTVTENGTNAPIADAEVAYTVYVDSNQQSTGTAGTDANGVAVIENMDANYFNLGAVTLSCSITKAGYQSGSISAQTITSLTDNISVSLIPKDTVDITFDVKDLLTVPISGADISITGYTSLSGQTNSDGKYTATLYKDETYNYTVSKNGYLSNSATGTTFSTNGECTVTLEEKSADATLAFSNPTPDAITYGNTTFVNTAASTIRPNGIVTYSVVSGQDVVSVDSTGKITTLKSGNATVRAVLPEDDTYQESVAEYSLTVNHAADSGLAFAKTTTAELTVSYAPALTFDNIASGGSGTGTITYSIESGDCATINSTTGQLSISKSGTVTVKATKATDGKYSAITSEYTLTVNPASQDVLSFDILTPEDQLITAGSFTNTVSGGSGSGSITYEIISGSDYASINRQTGELTFIKIGLITVKATKAADERYSEKTATYNLTIVKSPQTDLGFAISNPSEITYDPQNLTFENAASGGSGNGMITYSIESGDCATVDSTGKLTISKAGTVTVKATKAADDNYFEKSVTYSLTINKAEQTGFVFADGNNVLKTWSPTNNQYSNTASGGQTDGEISYTIVSASNIPSGGPCVTLTGSTVTMNGGGSARIKATKSGNDCYEDAVAEYELNIDRAYQSGFDFSAANTRSITYNQGNNSFSLTVEGGSGDGIVSYYVKSGDDIVTLNSQTGVYTVNKAGQVVFGATKAATGQYEAAQASITVNINQSNQSIVFNTPTPTDIIYGHSFSNAAEPVSNSAAWDGNGYAANTGIVYSVVSGNDIATVNSTTGVLSFNNGKVGTITVKAEKAGDSCYNSTSAQYSVIVNYLDAPAVPYILSGNTNNASGWYTGDVTITPSAGYAISYSNALSGNTWNESLAVNAEGYNGKTVYLKNASGGITNAIAIAGDDIRIDKTVPSGLSVSYSTSVLDTILETITFGFYKAPVTVTLQANDNTSFVDSFTYSYTVQSGASITNTGAVNQTIQKSDITFTNENQTATASFSIPAQFRGCVSFTATDTAGNISDVKNDDKVIVVDSIAPGITVSYDNNNATNTNYYNAARTATIKLEEANFFDADMTDLIPGTENEFLIITVGKRAPGETVYTNTKVRPSFTKNVDVYTATVEFTDDADYTFSVEYTDRSGNAAPKYETTFTVDKTIPQISIVYDNNNAANNNYYKENRTATITVTEHNFNAQLITVENFSAKDAEGATVSTRDYQEFLRNSTWNQGANDTHTLTVPFDVDAQYEYEISYSDLAGNGLAETVSDAFTVDKSAPENLNISYSTSVFDTVLETISFGFYKAPVTVTIQADDIISAVDYFTYSYAVQDGASATNVGAENVVISKSDITFSNGKRTATASFDIPAQFRGSVSFTATDTAGNTSENKNETKVVVVDNVAPGVTVSYDNNNAQNSNYYQANRTATITITEANFFDSDVFITVGKKLNNESTFTDVRVTPTFTKDGDVYTASVEFNENADYTFDISYTDKSGNIYDSYDKDEFTVDKIAPQISIAYDNNDVENNNYYKANRTATITVVEHNFDAQFIIVESFTAEDVGGSIVTIRDYQEYLRNSTWIRGANDTYTLTVPFDVDAQYDFLISYSDLAGNRQEYKIDEEFTIDKIAPDSLSVEYSTSVLDTILETITFGFYRAPVTVTIKADDGTSGVDYFTYSYIVQSGASTTNTGAENVIISKADITFINENNTATASFDIPAQFRGCISFFATDMSGNVSATKDADKVIVVDNVAPGVNVVYDNNNVQNTSYYQANRTATITITEANFYDSDVFITVGKRLNNESTFTENRVTPAFTKNGDVYTADIAFNEDADYTFDISYTDKSGNIFDSYVKDEFTVDKINPTIDVEYDNNSFLNGSYFKADRTATITITEHNFTAAGVEVSITATDAFGQNVSTQNYSNYLKQDASWTSNGDIHTAQIRFTVEANYTFDISYSDLAGNASATVDYGVSASPEAFTVDKTIPTASINIDNWNQSVNGAQWNHLLDSYSFGLWTNRTAEVNVNNTDVLSGVDIVEHFRSSEILTSDEVINYTQWITADEESRTFGYSVEPDERFIVYVHIVDKAGNEVYVSSDGVIVDSTLPDVEKVAPQVEVEPVSPPVNGIFNDSVDMFVSVIDPDVGGVYSGLNKVTYEVFNGSVSVSNATQSGTLFEFDNNTPQKADLVQSFVSSRNNTSIPYITVDKTLNNSNEVIIKITATDNSGNVTTKTCVISIDITAPTIDISYSNNDADSTKFFKSDRIATIVVTERNFDPDDVVITITNTDGVIPVLSSWSETVGNGNGDNTTHTATITYAADGDYTFDIAYTDLAENVCAGANYEVGTVAERTFTIDKTLPIIAVGYDNNNVLNGNYYKAARTATIVITEHNFIADRVQITLTATDDGTATTLPIVTEWLSNGDIHTATISYANDSLYTFDIAFADMAGNAAADFVAQSFYVDVTAPQLEITGVANESANNGDVIPVITYSDTNFDSENVTITLTGSNRGAVELDGTYSDIHNGKVFTFADFAKEQETDDIYTLFATLTDKAGNSSTQEITFSVNRFGSTYALSETVGKLNGTYVKTPVDIVITETNANELSNIKITMFKNDQTITLVEGDDYKIDIEGGNGNWYKYTYTVYKANFEDDGVYRLTFHSEDKAGNVAENTLDTKETEISFGVDKTAPTVVVSNLENGITYALDSLTVQLSANDNLRLESIVVFLDGVEYKTWNGEALDTILAGNGGFTFDVGGDSTSAHNVKIVVTDAAGNETVEEISDFFVTTNLWVRYYNNKVLFFSSIGGVILLAGLVVFLIVYKRKKKAND